MENQSVAGEALLGLRLFSDRLRLETSGRNLLQAARASAPDVVLSDSPRWLNNRQTASSAVYKPLTNKDYKKPLMCHCQVKQRDVRSVRLKGLLGELIFGLATS